MTDADGPALLPVGGYDSYCGCGGQYDLLADTEPGGSVRGAVRVGIDGAPAAHGVRVKQDMRDVARSQMAHEMAPGHKVLPDPRAQPHQDPLHPSVLLRGCGGNFARPVVPEPGHQACARKWAKPPARQ